MSVIMAVPKPVAVPKPGFYEKTWFCLFDDWFGLVWLVGYFPGPRLVFGWLDNI